MVSARKWVIISVALALLATGILAGAALHWQYLAWVRAAKPERTSLYEFDTHRRLIAVQGREPRPCPVQTPGTVVILAIGQSNAANAMGERYRSIFPGRVLSYFEGRCYEAESPLIGTQQTQGEAWTLLGNKLVARGAQQVIILPAAISGSAIRTWRKGEELNRLMLQGLRQSPYKPSVIIWQQGEQDYDDKTSAREYREAFLSMLSSLRESGVNAPIILSTASRCRDPAWIPDNPVTQAQRALPNGADIIAGPDTDRLIGTMDRADGCHFSGRGAEIFTDALLPPIEAALHARRAKPGP